MKHRTRLWVLFAALALGLVVLPTVVASATVGTMLVASDTTLTEDHNGEIQIAADNVTLDCAGHKVKGAGSGIGIDIDARSGVTVRNCDVSGFKDGIVVREGSGNTVEKNLVHDTTRYGIYLATNADGNTVSGNTTVSNGGGGILVWEADGNTVAGNKASDNGIGGIGVGRAQNTTVTNNEVRDSGNSGFGVNESINTTITNNVALNNGYAGFSFHDSQNSIVVGNVASENVVEGFESVRSTATFTDNDAHRNGDWGLDVDLTSPNTFKGNYCTGNGLGESLPSGLCQEEPVGLMNPTTGEWHLRHSENSVVSFYYGNPGDYPFMGDWNCNGETTPGLFRQSDAYAYLRNSNTQGIADIRFFFGNPSDIPLAGDFNGDGCDTLSIYRPSEARFYIINKLGENEGGLGAAEYSFLFGNPGDKPVVGDWDGDGVDEIGLHRETTGFFYYRNTLTTGIADGQFYFGDPGDRFVAGDWGVVNGVETPAMFRPSNDTFYFRWTLTQGIADSQFVWTGAGIDWLPVSGEFTLD